VVRLPLYDVRPGISWITSNTRTPSSFGIGASVNFGLGRFAPIYIGPPTVVFPYGYYDNDYPTDPFGDDAAMTYSPPIVPPEPSPPTRQRNVETFTVPSSAGGTRQIKIINCP